MTEIIRIEVSGSIFVRRIQTYTAFLALERHNLVTRLTMPIQDWEWDLDRLKVFEAHISEEPI